MSPPGAQVVKQSDESVKAIGTAVAEALLPTLNGLRDDKEDRHRLANAVETATATANAAMMLSKEIQGKVEAGEKRMDAMLGDGTGENGKLAIMGQNIRKTQDDTAELKGDMKTVLTTMSELKANSARSNTFMDGWKGLMVAGSAVLLVISIVGGIIGMLIKVYR